MKFTNHVIEYDLSNNYKLFLNTISGAQDVIDLNTYNKICSLREGNEIFDDVLVEQLKKRKYLFDNKEEEKKIIDEYLNYFNKKSLEVTNFTICPTMGCNLRCTYCFEDGIHQYADLMTTEQLDIIFNYIRISAKKTDNNVIITLFGGEPLLKRNETIVKKILNFCVETKCSLHVVTNGTTLDYYLPMFDKYCRENEERLALQITLDGDRMIHDQRRIRANGTGTFDKIIESINLASKSGYQTAIRINVDKENIDYLENIVEVIINYGWHNNKKINPYISPVYDFSMQSKTVFSEAELLSEILKKYPQILTGDCAIKGILSPSINFVQAFLNPNSDLKPWRLSYCEATNGSSIIFTPDGKINSCLSVAGHQSEYIGTFDSEGVKINKERSSRWFDRNPLKIKKCAECRYALICGGGCPIYALKKNRDTMNPVCPCIKEVLDVYFNVIKQIYINKIHQIKTSSKVKE